MFIKLLVPYKSFSVGAVVKAESLPSDVVKDLLFKGGAKALGNSQYTTRVMTAENTADIKSEKTNKKSKSKKVEAETEQDSE